LAGVAGPPFAAAAASLTATEGFAASDEVTTTSRGAPLGTDATSLSSGAAAAPLIVLCEAISSPRMGWTL
jgi:hypothetical protein